MTTPKMTRAEALAEAKRRWRLAYANVDHLAGCYDLTGDPKFYVGGKLYDSLDDLAGRDVGGSGNSWEAAFADADRRATK